MSSLTSSILGYGQLVLAGALYAAALAWFVLPSQVVLTGFEGIAAALSYYYSSPALFLILYALFQSVLLVFGWLKVGRPFAVRTIVVVGTVLALLPVLPQLEFAAPEPENERLILVVFGGILAGAAKALAFRARGSTGDEDIIAAYVASKLLKPVGAIAIVAAAVSTTFGLGLQLFDTGALEPVVNTLMYTTIYIFASAETLNTLYKRFSLTMLTVVSRTPDVVGKVIHDASEHRTYTIQDGIGGRTGERFQMVRTILTLEELPEILDGIVHADPYAFHWYHDIEGVSQRYYIAPIGSDTAKRGSSRGEQKPRIHDEETDENATL